MNQEKSHGKNFKLAGSFFLVVIILIIISLFWRVLVLVANSRFDGKHQFTLDIQGNATPRVICFTPETHSISILTVSGDVHESDLGKEIEVPIDAHIIGRANISVANALWDSMVALHARGDINVMDKVKLWLFVTSVHADGISKASVKVPLGEDVFTNVIEKTFLDKTIYQETKTIQIINASGVPGLGGRLAKLLSDVGGNVIMVSTAQTLVESSEISYTNMYSYTNKRIEQILGYPENPIREKLAIADIIITLGKNVASTQVF